MYYLLFEHSKTNMLNLCSTVVVSPYPVFRSKVALFIVVLRRQQRCFSARQSPAQVALKPEGIDTGPFVSVGE